VRSSLDDPAKQWQVEQLIVTSVELPRPEEN
jgi:hypothetical protein